MNEERRPAPFHRLKLFVLMGLIALATLAQDEGDCGDCNFGCDLDSLQTATLIEYTINFDPQNIIMAPNEWEISVASTTGGDHSPDLPWIARWTKGIGDVRIISPGSPSTSIDILAKSVEELRSTFSWLISRKTLFEYILLKPSNRRTFVKVNGGVLNVSIVVDESDPLDVQSDIQPPRAPRISITPDDSRVYAFRRDLRRIDFRITNSGSERLEISNISIIHGVNFSIELSPGFNHSVNPGKVAGSVIVRYQGESEQIHSDSLVINSNDPMRYSIELKLVGDSRLE